MKAMFRAIDGLPTLARLTMSGLVWGMICGFGAAMLMVLLYLSEISQVSNLWEGVYFVLLALMSWSIFGVIYGGAIGGVLGIASGVVAGLLLTVMVRILGTIASAVTTVVVVLAIQIAVGVMVEGTGGMWWILPVFAVYPLTRACLGAAKDGVDSATAEHRRDTLAA